MRTLTLERQEKKLDVVIGGMLEMPIENSNKDKAYILTAEVDYHFGKKNLLLSILVTPFGSKIRDILISDYQNIKGKGFFGLFDLNAIANSEDIYDNVVADEIQELKNQWNLKIKNSISILGVVEKIQN